MAGLRFFRLSRRFLVISKGLSGWQTVYTLWRYIYPHCMLQFEESCNSTQMCIQCKIKFTSIRGCCGNVPKPHTGTNFFSHRSVRQTITFSYQSLCWIISIFRSYHLSRHLPSSVRYQNISMYCTCRLWTYAMVRICKVRVHLGCKISTHVILSHLKFSKMNSKLVSRAENRLVLGVYSIHMQESETSSHPLGWWRVSA